MKLAAMAACLLAFLPVIRLAGQSNRSLTDSEWLLAQGATITVPGPQTHGAGLEGSEALQERLLLMRSTIKSLTESLAVANSEAELFKRQAADLTLRLEALGLTGLEKDPSKLEQRLLAAVRDLKLQKKQNEDAVNQLVRLTEAIQLLLKSTESIDPQMRVNVEQELRRTNEILGTPAAATVQPVEATLTDGMIVDLKEELSLAVANIGSQQGVRIGMPFQVWRDNKRIGEVRIVDVRERISGAIIQSLESENVPIKVGDRLKVDARK